MVTQAKPKTGPGSRTGKDARSGPPSPEANLTAKLVTVRLAPAVLAKLDELQERWGLSRSATVARAVMEAGGSATSSTPAAPASAVPQK